MLRHFGTKMITSDFWVMLERLTFKVTVEIKCAENSILRVEL